jgi:hypothetical protein
MAGMKRTTESLEIADQLVDIRIKLRIAAMAVLGLDEDNDDGGAIANMIFDLEGELGKVTEKVYPYQDAAAEPDAESSGKAPKAQRLFGAVFPFRTDDDAGSETK